MRIAYFDCFSGISGDMVLGALVDTGVSVDALRHELAKLPVSGYELEAREVRRAGLRGCKLDVKLVEAAHSHGTTLASINRIIDESTLSDRVKETSKRIFQRLIEAEARAHGVAPEEAHLHEAGGIDALVDIIGAVVGMELLEVDEVHASAIAVGGGTIRVAHGTLPVPAPATAELLKEVPIVPGEVEAELTTPTGAAIVTTLASSFGLVPPGMIEKIGYGAGARDFEAGPNLLRLLLLQPQASATVDSVWVLETNLDDLSPEIVAYVSERLFALGAIEVFSQVVQMKKGRTGVLLSVLTDDAHKCELEEALFAETTTFGVRSYRVGRAKLAREIIEVEMELGKVKVKVGRRDGRVVSRSPEYEDCRRLAAARGVPLKEVYRQALLAVAKYGEGPRTDD